MKERDGLVKRWKEINRLNKKERARLFNEEINIIADSPKSKDVPILRVSFENGKKLSADRAYNRLINWLDKRYSKRKTVEPADATKSEAPKKKSAKKAAVSEPAKKPAAEADPEKVAKLQAAIASARSSSDGEVGANELQEALDAGYSKFFVLGQAKEERS